MTPFPDLPATGRLILRPPTGADADDVLAAVTASYAELHRWMEWVCSPYGIGQARRFCADARGAFDDGRDFADGQSFCCYEPHIACDRQVRNYWAEQS